MPEYPSFHQLANDGQFTTLFKNLAALDPKTRQEVLKSYSASGFTLIHAAIHHGNLDFLTGVVDLLKNDAESLGINRNALISKHLNARINDPHNEFLHGLTPTAYFLLYVVNFHDEDKTKEIFKFMHENGGHVGINLTSRYEENLSALSNLAVNHGIALSNRSSIGPLVMERMKLFLSGLDLTPSSTASEKIMMRPSAWGKSMPAKETLNPENNYQPRVEGSQEAADGKYQPIPQIRAGAKIDDGYQPIPDVKAPVKKSDKQLTLPNFNLKQKFFLMLHGETKPFKQLQQDIMVKLSLYGDLKDSFDKSKKTSEKTHIKAAMEGIHKQIENDLNRLKTMAVKNKVSDSFVAQLTEQFTEIAKPMANNKKTR